MKRRKFEEDVCELNENEMKQLAKEFMRNFNQTNNDLESSKYRLVYCILVASSAIFTILISLTSLANRDTDHNCYSRVFLLIAFLSLAACILSGSISLFGKIDSDKRILRKRLAQIRRPGLGMIRVHSKNGKDLFFEKNPIKKRNVFWTLLIVSLCSFLISIISLIGYAFLK
jgi:hypothetical protein